MKLILQFIFVLFFVVSCNEKANTKSIKKSTPLPDTNVEVAEPPPQEVVDFAGSIESCGDLSCGDQNADQSEPPANQQLIDLGDGLTTIVDIPPTVEQAIISFKYPPVAKNATSTASFNVLCNRENCNFECKLGNDQFRDCPITSRSSNVSLLQLDGIESGVNSIQIRTSNYESAILGHTWENDNEKPNTLFSSSPPAKTSSQITFNFHCTDDTSTLGCIFECSMDDSNYYYPCSSPFITTVNQSGNHNIKIRAIDRFAKVDDTPLSFNWNVDSTAPVVSTSLVQFQVTRLAPSIDIQCSKENCTLECGINYDAMKACTSPFRPNLYHGKYKFRVRGTDQYGNKSGTQTIDFEIDQRAPEKFSLSQYTFNPALFPNRMVLFSTCSDQARPCSYYECQLNNGPVERCEFPKVFYTKGEGHYTLKAWAFDKVGNRSAEERFSWDTFAPKRKLVMGSNVGCVLEADKQVYCFGNNTYSQKPFGYTGSNEVLDFVKVEGLGPVDDVVPHKETFCALSNGAVLCWGYLTDWTNSTKYSSIVDGETYYYRAYKFYYPPIKMKGVIGFRHLTPHNFRDRYCGVNLGGNYVCAGENSSVDPLAVDSNADFVYFPKLVTGLPQGAEVLLSSEHCVYTNQFELYCKGDNFWGKAGFPNSDPLRSYKKHEDVVYRVIKIVEGNAHKCILDERGKMFCWGHSFEGVLGPNGKYSANGEKYEVTGVPGLIMDIAAGNFNTCALNHFGKVYCWGNNSNGILGAPPQNLSLTATPKLIPFPGKVVGIALGTHSYRFTGQNIKYGQLCAIQEDAQTYCLGTHFKNSINSPMTYTYIPFSIGGNVPPQDNTVNLSCSQNSSCSGTGKTCVNGSCTNLSESGGICDDNADCNADGLSCVSNRCEMTNNDLREETRAEFVDLYQQVNTRKVNLSGATINTSGIYGCSSSYIQIRSAIVTKLNNLYTRVRQCADKLASGALAPTTGGLATCKFNTRLVTENALSYGSTSSSNYCGLMLSDMDRLCSSAVSGSTGALSSCTVDTAYDACSVCAQ